MAKEVIKKDGTREPFDQGKIRRAIVGASQRTELSEERKREVIDQVLSAVLQVMAEKEEVSTTEIRETILSELNAVESSIVESWKKHEQEKAGA